jgi:Dinucleotide-utilizing enzymes involved in molybdopterin and thiamine biosynthesis family 1
MSPDAGENDERFCRTKLLLGRETLKKLGRAHVAVVGLGAVGSYAVEAIVRAGVGDITLVDFDTVRLSNFNRQLYAIIPNLNRYKAEIAHERVLQINPYCKVTEHRMFIDGATSKVLLEQPPDIIVDAIDSLAPKVHFMSACVKAGVKLISCLGAASRLDPFSIRVGDIDETTMCPLARMIRKKLHKLGVYSGIRCVYSIEQPAKPQKIEKTAILPHVEEGEYVRGRPRTPIGSMSYVPGMFGLIAASEVVSYIINKE